MFLNDAKGARSWELVYFAIESALRLGASVKLHTLMPEVAEMPVERALAHDWPESGSVGKSDMGVVLDRVPLRAGSLRVVISDLLSESPPEHAVVALTRSRGRAAVLAPFTHDESHPDWSGNVEFEDSETDVREKRRVEPEVLARYLRAYQSHFAMWREQCARRGIAFARVAGEGEFLPALRAEALAAGAIEM